MHPLKGDSIASYFAILDKICVEIMDDAINFINIIVVVCGCVIMFNVSAFILIRKKGSYPFSACLFHAFPMGFYQIKIPGTIKSYYDDIIRDYGYFTNMKLKIIALSYKIQREVWRPQPQ